MLISLKEKFAFYISYIFSILSLIGIVSFSLLFLLNINLEKPPYYYLVFAAIFGIAFYYLFFVRSSAREKMEFDTLGNKKKPYKYMNAKDRHIIDLERAIENEKLLSSSELVNMIKKAPKDYKKELNNLIGLNEVKKEVEKIEALAEYNKKYGRKKEKQSFHMCFTGNPGTGKTTLARIITGVLYKNHCIRQNKCLEIDASTLKGSTPDLTLKRTRIIMEKAKGGVLFIDEAYSLLTGINSSELISEIIKFMEDNKNDFVLIIAGYTKEMHALINSNPGIQSRIRKFIHFPDYTIEELKQIMTKTANEKNLVIAGDAYDKIEIVLNKAKKDINFGNARSVQNIFAKILENHAYNIKKNQQNPYIISSEDIDGI